ncbi:MAG: aldo/keto reductase [Deltaproteobacteria bacterium]|nr:aldo/keto reductase [Deltaproteobacteria bacterium]
MTFPETVRMAGNGPRFTRMGMGCWAVGGHGWGKVDDDESIGAIRRAFDRGIDFFDTADCYGLGKSERVLRQALGKSLKSLFVASKGGVRWDDRGRVWNDSSPAYLRAALEASLRRLGLERIPLYYIHKPDGRTPVPEIMGALSRFRKEGLIGEIGVANFSAAQAEEAVASAPVRAIQVRFNLMERERGVELASLCRRAGALLVTWGSLADGLLTGKFHPGSTFGEDDHRSSSPLFKGEGFRESLRVVEALRSIADRRGVSTGQLALRWVMDSYPWACPLFGAKTAAQVDENLGAAGWELSAEEMSLIDEFSGGSRKEDK